jgi:hypothetical protein
MSIEDISMKFDDESIFKSTPNLIRILIKKDEICARDSLKSKSLTQDDLELLSELSHYTLEGLIVHVLGVVLNPVEVSAVRVASLIEKLDASVRLQAE